MSTTERYGLFLKMLCRIRYVLMPLLLMLSSGALAEKQVTYFYTDQHGTVLATTDGAGNILSQGEHRPYGEHAMGSAEAGPGFTGHVEEPDSGLVYMQARYYDPTVGRFLSQDPAGVDPVTIGTFNRYRYAGNNPVNVIDPDGRQDCRSCEMSYGAAVGFALRNDPERLKAWQAAEEAATTARGATDGAAIGVAVGELVDAGELSGPVVAAAASKAITMAVTRGKIGSAGGKRASLPFTKAGKAQVKAENAEANGGRNVCEYCGVETVPAKRSERGVTPPQNEAHVDHAISKVKGGDGSPSNGQVLCRECNLDKSDK
jgi:RHS repeat-associated protein